MACNGKCFITNFEKIRRLVQRLWMVHTENTHKHTDRVVTLRSPPFSFVVRGPRS
jgi:hypothetical protein